MKNILTNEQYDLISENSRYASKAISELRPFTIPNILDININDTCVQFFFWRKPDRWTGLSLGYLEPDFRRKCDIRQNFCMQYIGYLKRKMGDELKPYNSREDVLKALEAHNVDLAW